MIPLQLHGKLEIMPLNETLLVNLKEDLYFFDYSYLHEFLIKKGPNYKNLVINLTEIIHLSSPGIGVLISLLNNKRFKLKLVIDSNEKVTTIIDMFNIRNLFDIYSSVEDSLEACA